MKKIISAIVVLVMIFSMVILTGCDKDKSGVDRAVDMFNSVNSAVNKEADKKVKCSKCGEVMVEATFSLHKTFNPDCKNAKSTKVK